VPLAFMSVGPDPGAVAMDAMRSTLTAHQQEIAGRVSRSSSAGQPYSALPVLGLVRLSAGCTGRPFPVSSRRLADLVVGGD
jgi:hypothetical protein